jgi:hypothetical protein
VDKPVDVRVKAQIGADILNGNDIKVLVTIDGNTGPLSGTNGSSSWTVDDNGEVVIWNTAIPTNLKGKKVLFQVEVDGIRTSKVLEATIK